MSDRDADAWTSDNLRLDTTASGTYEIRDSRFLVLREGVADAGRKEKQLVGEDGGRDKRASRRGNASIRLRDAWDEPYIAHKATIRVSIASKFGKWAALVTCVFMGGSSDAPQRVRYLNFLFVNVLISFEDPHGVRGAVVCERKRARWGKRRGSRR